jgi:hypothetical protein
MYALPKSKTQADVDIIFQELLTSGEDVQGKHFILHL